MRAKAREEGLWNLFIADDEHGAGLTNWEYGMLCEQMGRSPVAAPMSFNCAAPDTGNAEILIDHGTDEQQAEFLQPLLEGEARSCFSMTEPDVSGSDPTSLQTRAELDGDEWVINGHKWFTSGAVGADVRDRDGRHRPRRRPVHAGEHDPRPDRQPGLQPGPLGLGDGPRRRPRPLRGPLRGLPGAGVQPARRARRRLRDRPGPPRAPAASTTACARSGPPSARSR